MNTNPPATSGEEEVSSAPLEKLPKLNLPPKPVLATAATIAPAAASPTLAATSATKPIPEPPPIVATSPIFAPVSTPMTTSAKKSEPAETLIINKKRATLSMPLAMVAFIVALLGFIVQLVAFLHLF